MSKTFNLVGTICPHIGIGLPFYSKNCPHFPISSSGPAEKVALRADLVTKNLLKLLKTTYTQSALS
jgi:hypothetical protein